MPPGEYEFQVIEENLTNNSAGTGKVLKLTYEVLGPSQAGRKVFRNLNLSHPNAIAQKIGKEELSALCHAIGKPSITDTEELLWCSFRAKTKIEKDKNSGDERTGIAKYFFGDDLDPPAEKGRPNPPTRPSGAAQAGAVQGGGARQAVGGRALPWQGRNGGGAQPPQEADRSAPRVELDNTIPF